MDKIWFKSKTVIVGAILAIIGFADQVDLIDLKANLTSALLMLGLPEAKIGGIVTLVCLIFTLLRFASAGSVSLTKKGDG
jgi:hypothetical protein